MHLVMWVPSAFRQHCLEMFNVITIVQEKIIPGKTQKSNSKHPDYSIGFKRPLSMRTAAEGDGDGRAWLGKAIMLECGQRTAIPI